MMCPLSDGVYVIVSMEVVADNVSAVFVERCAAGDEVRRQTDGQAQADSIPGWRS